MLILLLILHLIVLFCVSTASETPIIGILSQESYSVRKYFPGEEVDSYIAASYVKYLESAGARVIPVWIGQNESYYKRVVQYTNGILFPGGATYFNETDGYGEAAKQIYQFAVDANNVGSYFPLWGTCLGMQVLPFAALKGQDIRVDCRMKKIAIPLEFTKGYNNSKIFSSAPNEIINILKNQNVTYNEHIFCLLESVMMEHGLLQDWNIITTNKDMNNLEFISTMEHDRYPFYGIQYHPEKNQFEFKRNVGIPHTRDSIRVSQYFANFFVDECRKSNHTFPDTEIERSALIYNYVPRYIGKMNSSYEQVYTFQKHDYDDNVLI